jgi:hypothetical protein
MNLLPTHYFTAEQLRPTGTASPAPFELLPREAIEECNKLAEVLQDRGTTVFEEEELSARPHLLWFLALLRFLGPVVVLKRGTKFEVSSRGPLGRDVPRLISLYLTHGFHAFDDWTRRHRASPDRLAAIEFLHYLELRRIDSAKNIGTSPEIIREVPVAFAIIKAYSEKRRQDVYLLELNKDWNRCLREIEEELSIPRDNVSLTPLTRDPLTGYSLSGGHGTLGHYPCMIYWARIRGEFKARTKDTWLTESEFSEMRRSHAPGLVINPVYLDFLFHQLPEGLRGLQRSLDGVVEPAGGLHRVRDFVLEHKVWLIPTLAILAGLIAVMRGLLE